MDTKKRLRDLTWKDYGISKHRYRELQAFCRQYTEKKQQISYGLNAVIIDGQPHGNSVGNPTEQQAIENARYSSDVRMIEEAASKAAPDFARYILRSVTEGLPFEAIEYDKNGRRIPVNRTDFYAYRRLFYYYLHKMKFGTN